MSYNKKHILILILAVLIAIASISIKHSRIFYINTSPSVSCGLFILTDALPIPGDYVIFNSSIINNFNYKLPNTLIKRLAFHNDERYLITNTTLSIDGSNIVRKYKPLGNVMSGILKNNECLVLGTNPHSLDSRYFGPIAYSSLKSVKPIFLWRNMGNIYE
jgi:type IV secretory pathway protease TraF